MKRKVTLLIGSLSGVVLLLFIFLNGWMQVERIQKNTERSTSILFNQIKNVVVSNDEDMQKTLEQYKSESLSRARAAAYMIQNNKSEITNVEEMQKIADLLQVDEVHIFNTHGVIYAGSEPKYYGYSVDSGEQIGFFAPMLDDTSMELCQDIVPNTAEEKPMQYAAVWLEDKSGIVQIGVEPKRVLEQVKKNELSYIFSLLAVEKGSAIFAVDPETNRIVGSSKDYMLGKNISEYGIDEAQMKNWGKGFQCTVRGNKIFCIFDKTDTVIIGRFLSAQKMYGQIVSETIRLFFFMLAIYLIIAFMIVSYITKNVLDPITAINADMEEIAAGDFDRSVEENSSKEFAMLSEHINDMVKGILDTTNTISNVVEMCGLSVGVYEYHSRTGRVRITSRVPEILHLDEREAEELCADVEHFKMRMDQLFQRPYEEENDIYILSHDGEEYYIKVERVERKNSVFAMISECTEDIREKQALQQEVKQDVLTGLYTRRALYGELDELFENPELLQCGALVVVDADDLKKANDTCGHESGDRYLTALANILESLHAPGQITARLGGDEFAVFFCGVQTKEEAKVCVERLRGMRDCSTVQITDGTEMTVCYSMGAGIFPAEGDDWHQLLKLADERMYADKQQRKKCRV